jgi:dihydroflavonol-4-reductase
MVAVTGATGHIGNTLVREILARGERVRAAIPAGEDLMPLEGLAIERVAGDVRDFDSLTAAFGGADIVYHLAGIITISRGHVGLLQEVNVEGTRNVVHACLKTGVRRLVYTSSVHALEEAPYGTPVCEPKQLEPDKATGDYGKSKARATIEVLEAVKQGLDAVIAFPTGVIGPYDYKQSEMGQLVIDFVKRKLPAYVDGAYDFVDVRDVAAALIAAAEKGRKGEGYVLSGNVITVPELMALLEKLTGVKAPRTRLPLWLAKAVATFSPLYYFLARSKPRFTRYSLHVLKSNCLMDNRKARTELAFAPRPIEATVADSIKWFRDHGRL